MIVDTIREQITKAMKSGDAVRLSTMKMLSAALTNAEITKKREKLTGDEELAVVRAEAKKRKDAIEMYEKAGEKERAEKEKAELEMLQEYLPKELSDEELEKIVVEAIQALGLTDPTSPEASLGASMGKVMGVVMSKTQGRADGKRVMSIVKEKLA